MSLRADTRFHVQQWEEHTVSEVPGGPRITRAHVVKTYEGDFEGESTIEYVMIHYPDGRARFTGLEQLSGNFDDNSGSFVLSHEGVFEEGTAKATCWVVENSGTEDLDDITGEATFEAAGRSAEMEFQYSLD